MQHAGVSSFQRLVPGGRLVPLGLFVLVLCAVAVPLRATGGQNGGKATVRSGSGPTKAAVLARYARLPLAFEADCPAAKPMA